MFMIEDIWHGRFTPSERMIRKGSRYQKLSMQGSDAYELFYNELSAEGKKAYIGASKLKKYQSNLRQYRSERV